MYQTDQTIITRIHPDVRVIKIMVKNNSFEQHDAKIVHFDGLMPLYRNSEDGNCANVLLFRNGNRILVDVVEDGELRDEPWEILIYVGCLGGIRLAGKVGWLGKS